MQTAGRLRLTMMVVQSFHQPCRSLPKRAKLISSQLPHMKVIGKVRRVHTRCPPQRPRPHRPGADGITSDGFNAYERAQFELAFDAISDVADISFVEVTSVEDADFVMILDDDEIINLPLNEQFSAFFVVASSTQAVGVFDANGQGWDGFAGGGLEVGGNGYQTIRMTTAVVQIFWTVSGSHLGTMVNLT